MLLLLSGRPGAGKSELGAWMAREFGFVHVDTDNEWASWGGAVCAESLQAAVATRNRARSLGPDVVIEWGFRPTLLKCVRYLRSAGFVPWWLDGDEPAARQAYITRRGSSPAVMAAYQVQVDAIQAAWPELQAFYGDHVVTTLTTGRTFVPLEVTAATIIAGADS